MAPIDDPDESGRRSRAKSLSQRSLTSSPSPARMDRTDGSTHVITASALKEELNLVSATDENEVVFHLRGSLPHALFMDCTHDNEMPYQKRMPADYLSNAAVAAFASCAVGSVRGYDELTPYHLNVVTEGRKYSPPDPHAGITEAKRTLNQLHFLMGQKGYSEIHVHQENDFILVYRQNPMNHSGFLLVARTAFNG